MLKIVNSRLHRSLGSDPEPEDEQASVEQLEQPEEEEEEEEDKKAGEGDQKG